MIQVYEEGRPAEVNSRCGRVAPGRYPQVLPSFRTRSVISGSRRGRVAPSFVGECVPCVPKEAIWPSTQSHWEFVPLNQGSNQTRPQLVQSTIVVACSAVSSRQFSPSRLRGRYTSFSLLRGSTGVAPVSFAGHLYFFPRESSSLQRFSSCTIAFLSCLANTIVIYVRSPLKPGKAFSRFAFFSRAFTDARDSSRRAGSLDLVLFPLFVSA